MITHAIYEYYIVYICTIYKDPKSVLLYIYNKGLSRSTYIFYQQCILIFEINNKAILIYKREFITRLGLIYHYTRLIIIAEIVYSTVEYYVHTISTLLYTHFICVHILEHGTFIAYSNNNNNNSKKVSTMT